jgi:hypothetical protein
LKLALDKVKSGNFNMVKIYFEGLTPRIDKQWEKLGKKPKHFERKIIDDSALKADLAKAQEERAKYEATQKANAGAAAGADAKKEWGWKDSVPPDKLLNLVNGMLVISLSSLYDEIAAMKDKDYDHHFNDPKANFADWAQKVTGDTAFAENLRVAKDKGSALKILELKRDGKPMPPIKKEPPKEAAPASAPPASGAPGTPPLENIATKPDAKPETKPDLEKIVGPSEAFRLENGVELKSLKELKEYLPKIDDATFKKHVGDNYNHFADWVRGTLHDEQLASKMAQAKTKEQLLAAVS